MTTTPVFIIIRYVAITYNKHLFPFSAITAAAQIGAGPVAATSTGTAMTSLVMAAVLSAIATVLVSLFVVLVVRQVQHWRAARSAPSDHPQFNRPPMNFPGFGSVSSKLSAMTLSSIGSMTVDEA